ncbi:MAG TPA: hypothetical protein VK363_19410 [Pyrinomonadaceae bacterium]|nr:hypothetical protein [Pyrinomonadaceae bacterium]
MATGTSVVGAWNLFLDWDCDGKAQPGDGPIIFRENGSMSGGGFGNWIQVEGMVAWSFYPIQPIGLFYTANVTRDAMIGVMGFVGWSRRGQGCFYATRASSDADSATRASSDADSAAAASLEATPTEQDASILFGPEGKD